MHIKGIRTHTRTEYGICTHIELRRGDRVVAETSCGPGADEVARQVLDLKCGLLNVPVPKESDE